MAEPMMYRPMVCDSAVEALWCDGVVKAHQESPSILLGPACLGYIHGGQGRQTGPREDVSLTVRGALAEFAAAVDLGESATLMSPVGDDVLVSFLYRRRVSIHLHP